MSLRVVTFGDLELDSWGVVVSLGAELPSFAVLGPPGAVIPVRLEGDSSAEADWRIAGETIELTVSPNGAGDGTPTTVDPADLGLDQFVTVGGRVGDAGERVDLLGCRSERAEELQPGRFQLLRKVSAWFARGEGVSVVAVRPRRAGGHGDENLTATLFAAGQTLTVPDPRLSTTYSGEGWPVRASLELWLTEPEQEADEEDEEQHAKQYPRRAAGEVAGSGVIDRHAGLGIRAQPFRWRSEGQRGAGVYLLVAPE